MLSILISIAVFVHFFTAARRIGKNGVLWGFVGTAVFLVSANVLTFILLSVVLPFLPAVVAGQVTVIVSTLGALLIGWFVAQAVYKKFLDKPDEVRPVLPPQSAGLKPDDADANAIGDPMGMCPNCDVLIPLASLECKYCQAQFGPAAAWRVRPLPQNSGLTPR